MNVITRRVRLTMLAVEKQKCSECVCVGCVVCVCVWCVCVGVCVCVCVCVKNCLSSMHCSCAVLYCHLWSVWLYHIFPHYLTNGTIFQTKGIEGKMFVLILCQRLSETLVIQEELSEISL